MWFAELIKKSKLAFLDYKYIWKFTGSLDCARCLIKSAKCLMICLNANNYTRSLSVLPQIWQVTCKFRCSVPLVTRVSDSAATQKSRAWMDNAQSRTKTNEYCCCNKDNHRINSFWATRLTAKKCTELYWKCKKTFYYYYYYFFVHTELLKMKWTSDAFIFFNVCSFVVELVCQF